MNKEKNIDYGINKIIEETEGGVHESNSDDYKYKVLNSGNTSDKLFKTDKEFIEGAEGLVG